MQLGGWKNIQCFLANHNKMSVLWVSLGIYIVGIAVVLFVRPSIMFNASGWKEFGLANTANYSVFPFWMFAIVWAIVSYALASLFSLTIANTVLASEESGIRNNMNTNMNMNTNVNLESIATPISQVGAPVSAPPPSPTLPGYYILENVVNGPGKYVYYGPNPPPVGNIAS
jgi:hypothetical protein